MTNKKKLKSDPVAAPRHYKGDGVIDAMRAMRSMMTGVKKIKVITKKGKVKYKKLKSIVFYWWGCSFKYLWRWPWKNGLQDLYKCRQCLDYLIEEVES